MSRSLRAVALGAVATAIPATAPAAQHGHGHPAQEGGFGSEMHRSMEEMTRAMLVAMSGDPDRDFLAMMIPHHQGAVEMARLVLVHGRDPLTRQLADEIIASQRAEIASMRARLAILEAGDGAGEFPSLSGTRGR
jgi:uncharacterized protein (DUF305 family)